MSIETTNIPDDLKQRLVDSLDKVAEWVRQAEVFAADQAPLVVQDVLAWGWYGYGLTAVALLAMGIVFGVLSFVLGRMAWRNDKWADPSFPAILSMLLGIAAIVSMGFVPRNAEIAIKAKVAPRVYILEKIGVLK